MSSHIHDWQADFAVFSEDGQLAAIAEAKKKTDARPGWATAWFRNYLAHQQSSAPPFVLLATPEKLYVWKRPSEKSSSEPTAVADGRRLFSPYLRSKLDPADLSSRTFEFVVGAWLDDLSHHLWRPSAPEEIIAFVETGLLEAVQNGRVVADVAA
jgi:hypothetical protein